MRRILFVCSRNRLRSPTAAAVFADHPGVETDSAGLSPDAETVLHEDQIEWADVILLMEPIHRTRLQQKFGPRLTGKRIAVLGIPDDYEEMAPALVSLLRKRCAPFLP